MWVINPAVGCHYFPPGLQLPPLGLPLRGLLPISLLGEQRHNGCERLPKTVTRQRRDCDLNPGPSAPEFSTNHSATEPGVSHLIYYGSLGSSESITPSGTSIGSAFFVVTSSRHTDICSSSLRPYTASMRRGSKTAVDRGSRSDRPHYHPS